MKNHKIQIVPHLLGTERHFSDVALSNFYMQMQSEDTADLVFIDGSVQSADEFTQAMHKAFFYLITVNDIPAGMIWLTRRQSRWAQFNFVSFKWTWGKLTTKIGRFALRKLINLADDQGYLFDAFLGVTPLRNRLACNFLKKMGWKELGVMENGVYNFKSGKSESALFSYFTRECLK